MSSESLKDYPDWTGVEVPQRPESTDSSNCRKLESSVFRALLEEPTHHVNEFLSTYPSPQSITEKLSQYRAFVLELSSKVADANCTDFTYQNMICHLHKENARHKFSSLTSNQSQTRAILKAYKYAVHTLDRALRRKTKVQNGPQRHRSQLAPENAEKSSRTTRSVKELVCTGLEMLLGESCKIDRNVGIDHVNSVVRSDITQQVTRSCTSHLSLNSQSSRPDLPSASNSYIGRVTLGVAEGSAEARDNAGQCNMTKRTKSYQINPLCPPKLLSPRNKLQCVDSRRKSQDRFNSQDVFQLLTTNNTQARSSSCSSSSLSRDADGNTCKSPQNVAGDECDLYIVTRSQPASPTKYVRFLNNLEQGSHSAPATPTNAISPSKPDTPGMSPSKANVSRISPPEGASALSTASPRRRQQRLTIRNGKEDCDKNVDGKATLRDKKSPDTCKVGQIPKIEFQVIDETGSPELYDSTCYHLYEPAETNDTVVQKSAVESAKTGKAASILDNDAITEDHVTVRLSHYTTTRFRSSDTEEKKLVESSSQTNITTDKSVSCQLLEDFTDVMKEKDQTTKKLRSTNHNDSQMDISHIDESNKRVGDISKELHGTKHSLNEMRTEPHTTRNKLEYYQQFCDGFGKTALVTMKESVELSAPKVDEERICRSKMGEKDSKEGELEKMVLQLNTQLKDVQLSTTQKEYELLNVISKLREESDVMKDSYLKTIERKDADVKNLKEELGELKELSVPVTDYQCCQEENIALKQKINQLECDLDVLNRQHKNSTLTPAKTLSQDSPLEIETSEIRKLKDDFNQVKENLELKDLELTKLRDELNLAKKDIELYHKNQPPNCSTAYIVQMRDATIAHLQSKIVEFQSFFKRKGSPASPTSKIRPAATIKSEKSEMLSIISDEASRLSDRISRLERDNVKLIELVQQKDAKMFEMNDEMEWLKKGSSQQELITTYTQKLKQGEEEMGKLHQTMEMLTRKHSALLLAKDNKTSQLQTNYARKLSQLTNGLVIHDEYQGKEIRRLCAELDTIEKRNYELEKALDEYEEMKTELLPKLRADLENLRQTRSQLRSEFDQCNRQLKEVHQEIQNMKKAERKLLQNHSVEVSRLKTDLESVKIELDSFEATKKTALEQKDLENGKLKKQLTDNVAKLQESERSVLNWKIKAEDVNRQIVDLEERHSVAMRAKSKEIVTLTNQVEELSHQVDEASSTNDEELFGLQSQLKELQRLHIDTMEQNETAMRLKEEEMKKLYCEIGDTSARLHSATKEKEAEIQRLKSDLALIKDEKDALLAEYQTSMQEKQAEIRKLVSELEEVQVEAASLRANKEEEVNLIQKQCNAKMEQFATDRASLVAVKDNEIKRLREELERLSDEVKNGGNSISNMRQNISALEKDKDELLLLKDQWQADLERSYSEYEKCRNEKLVFEEMVDKVSKEMEERIEGLKAEHNEMLVLKENQIRELYIQVENIARERGNMSAHLHNILQEKEETITELFNKLKEYEACLDRAEEAFRTKLKKKSQEIKDLREEIRKIGAEGIHLLDMREQEINDMRGHMKDMLKAMECKSKPKRSVSQVAILRPPKMSEHPAHLQPVAGDKKPVKAKKAVSKVIPRRNSNRSKK